MSENVLILNTNLKYSQKRLILVICQLYIGQLCASISVESGINHHNHTRTP